MTVPSLTDSPRAGIVMIVPAPLAAGAAGATGAATGASAAGAGAGV